MFLYFIVMILSLLLSRSLVTGKEKEAVWIWLLNEHQKNANC